ncbi:MAG: tRNA1(Val) (adenine(37)-N6)-methyltransferase [Lachnospiraceae bacterium]|nr:tRNA1(Val) (adenine(37)-N6)-methyltransferase [Candidatus Colinaster equi]
MNIEKVKIKETERIDDLQRNGYRIIQDPGKFCFGIDAVLLSAFAKAKKGDKVLDMGTGTGVIPILMAARTDADHFTALEIQEESADMAQRSVSLNGLEDRIDIVKGDIKQIAEILPKAKMDVVTCNPPYMINDHGLKNDADAMTIARHEILCTLEDVISGAASMLKSGGNFYMVHRPFRLSEICVLLTKYNLEPKRMRFVYPYADKEPNMVLIEAKRGAKSRVTIEKPLIVYEAPGKYTPEVRDLYEK